MSFELISLSSATPVAQVGLKRHKTPLPESESPQKYLLVSPKGAVPANRSINLAELPSFSRRGPLSPPGSANVGENHAYPDIFLELLNQHSILGSRTTLPHAHQEAEETPVEEQHPRHVVLPFDLRKDPLDADNRKLIYEIFPDIETIGFDRRFLRLLMSRLPPKPWPQTIAGVPAFFTADPAEEGPIAPIKRFGAYHIRLHEGHDYRHNSAKRKDVFDLVKEYFSKVRIEITEIQYWDNFVVIVLEDDNSNMSVVPRVVASCPCYYLFESEMGRAKDLPARRIKEPGADAYDDSEYTNLRPGVMLSSGKDETDGYECRTTAGVLVRDSQGRQYVTVASHGFPHGPRVFHPRSTGGREIGEIVMELTCTNTALLKLRDGETFTNELFESSHMLKPPPPSLKGFMPASEIIPGDFVYMDSAFAGFGEGTVNVNATTRVRRVPTDVTEWIETRWDYMGQGSSQKYVDGACGSVMWDDEGRVLGFFRYAPASGHFLDWCQSMSATHLIDRGFTVV